MPLLQPYWSPSYPTTSPTAPLLLPSYASPYTEYTSVHPAEITPMPSTYLLPVSEYQVGLVYKWSCCEKYNKTTEKIAILFNSRTQQQRTSHSGSILCPNTNTTRNKQTNINKTYQDSTTEDITFAEAFSALANFDPALPPEQDVEEVAKIIFISSLFSLNWIVDIFKTDAKIGCISSVLV